MTKEQLKRYREWKLELQDINAGISNSTIHDSVSGSKKNSRGLLAQGMLRVFLTRIMTYWSGSLTLKRRLKKLRIL